MSKLTKELLMLIFCLVLALPFQEVNGDVLGTKTYSDIVYIGNSFVWTVEKWSVSSDTKPEAETVLKEGDEIKFTIINMPEVNYSEPEEVVQGFTGFKYVNITVNGLVFDSIEDFLLIPYPFISAIVIPVSAQQIESEGQNNTMELMQDMFGEPEEGFTIITNEITESYYELEYTFEIAPMSGYVRLKFDVETGLLLLSHEDIDIYQFDNPEKLIASSNILLISEEEELTTTAINSLVPLLFSILIPAIILRKKNS